MVGSGGLAQQKCIFGSAATGPPTSLLLTTRHVLDGRFGLKVPQWNGRKQLAIWRSEWAVFANATLRAGGFRSVSVAATTSGGS